MYFHAIGVTRLVTGIQKKLISKIPYPTLKHGESDTIKNRISKMIPWGHCDLNAGHKTPSLVGYQATLWVWAIAHTDADFTLSYPGLVVIIVIANIYRFLVHYHRFVPYPHISF
jgi:hypothetical protein